MDHVFVTGVSTGIGYATAAELIKQGFYVFGSVRTQADAEAVKNSLKSGFTPLIMDVTDKNTVQSAAVMVKAKLSGAALFGLVNNAGIAVIGPLMHISLEEFRKQVDVNVVGVLNVTQALFPLLKGNENDRSKPGRIINISSVSGKLTYPFLGAYSSSKFALEALSDALRRELMLYGIDVIVIEPGNTQSAIWQKIPDLNKFKATDYADYMYPIQNKINSSSTSNFMPASKIAQTIIKALTILKPKTRYVITRQKLLSWHLLRLIPDRMLDKLIAKKLGF